MAEAVEKNLGELEQIRIGPIAITPPPMRMRIHWNILPDFTIDLTRPPGTGLISILRPRATVLVGDAAYSLDPFAVRKITSADPAIFRTPTFFDSFMQMGIIPTVLLVGLTGFGIYHLYGYLTRR